MSWRDWIDHGIEAQFNPRLAVGDEAESWLNGWAEESLRRQVELGGVFDIAYGAHELMRFDCAPGDTLGCRSLSIFMVAIGGRWINQR